ncbi:MAG: LolA family protein [Solirubrobacterales bacterium]
MDRVVIGVVVLSLAIAGAASCQTADPNAANAGGQVQAKASDANEVDRAIQNLQDKAAQLKSYQAKVDYVTRQPLLDSTARREGVLYYAKTDGRSSLRIDFLTLQQDEEPEQRYVEQYLFDGVWLTIVNHQTRRVERRQMTEPNKPVDAFSLASRHMPVLGFSKMEDLRKQFDVTIAPEPNSVGAFEHLHLTVRPDSPYKDDYTQIDFWVDRTIGLPAKIHAVTTEEDVHEIRLVDPQVNAGVDPKIFQIDIPKGFTLEVIPLEKKTPQG